MDEVVAAHEAGSVQALESITPRFVLLPPADEARVDRDLEQRLALRYKHSATPEPNIRPALSGQALAPAARQVLLAGVLAQSMDLEVRSCVDGSISDPFDRLCDAIRPDICISDDANRVGGSGE